MLFQLPIDADTSDYNHITSRVINYPTQLTIKS